MDTSIDSPVFTMTDALAIEDNNGMSGLLLEFYRDNYPSFQNANLINALLFGLIPFRCDAKAGGRVIGESIKLVAV